MKGLAVERACAFVEQGRGKTGDAGLPLRVLIGAAEKEKSSAIKGTAESRTSHASMPPGLFTRSICMALRRDGEAQRARENGRQGRAIPAADGESGNHRVHERFSSGRVSLTR